MVTLYDKQMILLFNVKKKLYTVYMLSFNLVVQNSCAEELNFGSIN